MAFLDRLRRSVGIKPSHAARLAAFAPLVDRLEAQLRGGGWWQESIEQEKLQFRQAFGMDTMAFSQWLQFVFLPAARAMLAGERRLPDSSMVGTQAIREFDGDDAAAPLVSTLCHIDAVVNGTD